MASLVINTFRPVQQCHNTSAKLSSLRFGSKVDEFRRPLLQSEVRNPSEAQKTEFKTLCDQVVLRKKGDSLRVRDFLVDLCERGTQTIQQMTHGLSGAKVDVLERIGKST